MQEDTDPVLCHVVAGIVAEFERLMDEARDKWSLPKRVDAHQADLWSGREIGYREALRVMAHAGLAPAKYASQ